MIELRILVTGAGGFVCRHIVASLARVGHKVTALDRAFDADLADFWGPFVTLLTGEIADLPDDQFDLIIHGAAITASPASLGITPWQHLRANLDPTLSVMDWAQNHARRAIFISSDAVHRATSIGPVDESLLPTPEGPYALAKFIMEGLVQTAVKDSAVDWVVIRLSNMYGPGEMPRASRPRISLLGQMLNNAVQRQRVPVYVFEPARDWTLVNDVGRAVVALVAAPRWRWPLYNVASGHMASPVQLAAILDHYVPGVTQEFIQDRPADRPAMTKLGFMSSARLFEDTGFDSWTPLDEGVQQTLAWLQHKMAESEAT